MHILDQIKEKLTDGTVEKYINNATDVINDVISGSSDIVDTAKKLLSGAAENIQQGRQASHSQTVDQMQQEGDGAHRLILRRLDEEKASCFNFYDPSGHIRYTALGLTRKLRYTLTLKNADGDTIGTITRKNSWSNPCFRIQIYGDDFGTLRALKDNRKFIYDAYDMTAERSRLGNSYTVYNNIHQEAASFSDKKLQKGYWAVTYGDYADEIIFVAMAVSLFSLNR